jgi:hypothetical protein
MTTKEFLEKESTINRSAIAFLMYPDNKTAPTHLNKKLTGLRKWNAADEKAAKDALNALAERIENLK